MSSLSPCVVVAKRIEELLSGGRGVGENLVSELMRAGLQRIVHEALESEVRESLGRNWYARRKVVEKPREKAPWRKGYKDRS